MVKQSLWKQEEAKDSKIVALVTKVNELESKLASKQTSSSTSTSRKAFGRKFRMDDWRMVKDGDSKTVDGDKWWWCPHHVQEGVYDGLCVKYHPEKHDKWVERKKNLKIIVLQLRPPLLTLPPIPPSQSFC